MGKKSNAERVKMTIAEKLSEVPVEKPTDKRRALGRGLDSLLPGRPRVVSSATPITENRSVSGHGTRQPSRAASGDEVREIPLEMIDPNPYQTRTQFDEVALNELAESIKTNGLLQPIVVRPKADGRYILVLGERRCRASKMAGEKSVPAMVRSVSDQHAAEMTVVENLVRKDLNCLEQALAFSRLGKEFGLTQEQIGQRTGVSRESVANHLRMLRLPESVQQHLANGKLTFSEARVLLQLEDPKRIELMAEEAAQRGYSVAFLQSLVDNANHLYNGTNNPTPPVQKPLDPNVRAAQSELEKALGLRVRIMDRKGKGRIVIHYASLGDFDTVVEMLKGS